MAEPLAAPEYFGESVEQGCHVVIPSLPGYAFSAPCDNQARGPRFISEHIHYLMSEVLGYSRYIVAGGDWGAAIADWLAADHPAAVIAQHSNTFVLGRKVPVAGARPDELIFLADDDLRHRLEGAYHDLQATRPESIAYALADSPVGAAAYLLDKWQRWTDTRFGTVESIIGTDHLITELMLYLVTDSLSTSMWIYPGFALEGTSAPGPCTIPAPYGYTGYVDPLGASPPRQLVERSRNLVMWQIELSGGHFPHLERPVQYIHGLREFVARVITLGAPAPL